MRLALCLVASCGAALLAPAAGANHPRLIVLGASIGPVKLGMSERAVVRVLGTPRVVENANYGGKPLRRGTYRIHGSLYEVSY
jgi:hypothetical protein